MNMANLYFHWAWLIHISIVYRLDKNDDQLLKELMDIHHSITRLKYSVHLNSLPIFGINHLILLL